jgi:hypothetical protein
MKKKTMLAVILPALLLLVMGASAQYTEQNHSQTQPAPNSQVMTMGQHHQMMGQRTMAQYCGTMMGQDHQMMQSGWDHMMTGPGDSTTGHMYHHQTTQPEQSPAK